MDFKKYEDDKHYEFPPATDILAAEQEAKATIEALKAKRKQAERDIREARRAEQARLQDVFKQDMFEELGITNNPRREKLFEIAWEMGHSEGYSGVYNAALDLLPLIEE